jgi:hemoglobin
VTTSTPNLYERLGGRAAIESVTEDFYDKVLDHPVLAPWFARLDMGAQKRAFSGFVRMSLDGGGDWHGRSLRVAHAGLVGRGLTDEHFDLVVGLYAETLAEHGAAAETIGEVAEWAESVRDEVLGR